jgi:hypothetical protein
VHPSSAEAFEWDGGNVEELARHHVTPPEVEAVFDNEPGWKPNKRGMAGNWKMVGRTDGDRVITAIVLWKEDRRVLRPIMGWDATKGERTEFLRS